jgi:flagellar biosynthetic protein FliP
MSEAEGLTLFNSIQFDQAQVSPALQAFAILTILSLSPSILIMFTSFTRIIIVLSILRNALGLQQTPPNMILISLALFLTLFTMMPVANQIYNQAYKPYQAKQISAKKALEAIKMPLREFMLHQTREKDIKLILELSKEPIPQKMQDIRFYQLIPAFLISELQTAFQIGFMIFLPFLLVDLIISAILMTMGMMMMPPMTLSLPIKILLFILINGWELITKTLVLSIRT